MNPHQQQLLQQQLLLQQQAQQQAVQLQQAAQQQLLDRIGKYLQRGQDSTRSIAQRRESLQEIRSIILHPDNRYYIKSSYAILAQQIQHLLQDKSNEIGNTAALLLGALGSILDVTVQGFYSYIFQELLKRQSHADHLKQFRHLVLSLAECITCGDPTFHAQCIPNVSHQLSSYFQNIKLIEFVGSATYPIFAIGKKYPLLFYPQLNGIVLNRLYEFLFTATWSKEKTEIAEKIVTYYEIQSQAVGNFPTESFAMLNLLVTVLNRSIKYYTKTIQSKQPKMSANHSIELQLSLQSFYAAMHTFNATNRSESKRDDSHWDRDRNEEDEAQRMKNHMRLIQFLNQKFVSIILHNLECIKCCIVTLPDIGPTELQLFQLLFECLSLIPVSMHSPRLVKKIYSVIREFTERFLNYPNVNKFASLLLSSANADINKDNVWFNDGILIMNNYIRLILDKHLSNKILFRYNQNECLQLFLKTIEIFINNFGNYWLTIIHDVLHLNHIYDLILNCKPAITMYFLEVLGLKLIQNKQITIGITTISVISQHIHYLLTDTKALNQKQQFPTFLLRNVISKLNEKQRQIVLSFFIQSYSYMEPIASPLNSTNDPQNSPNNILCINILQSVISILYRSEVRQSTIWTKKEVNIFKSSLHYHRYFEFYKLPSLPLIRSNGQLMELFISILNKLRKCSTWKETENHNDILCQFTICLSLLSLSWLPFCTQNVSAMRHCDGGDKKLKDSYSLSSSSLSPPSRGSAPYKPGHAHGWRIAAAAGGGDSAPSATTSRDSKIIEILVRWVDSIIHHNHNNISYATYDRLAKIFANLTLFPDTNIKVIIGISMKSILQHLCCNKLLFTRSIIFDLWSHTALSRITDKDLRVENAYLKLLEFCGTNLKHPGFTLNFNPSHPLWVIPFMSQIISLPLPHANIFTPMHFKQILNYFGSKIRDNKFALSSFHLINLSACQYATNHQLRWERDAAAQQKEGYQVLQKFFEENIMYIYHDTYYYNQITESTFNRQKAIDKARERSRRTGRNYMNLQLKLLALHSQNDTFIARYWLANNIAKYLIKYKLSTEFGNATKTLLYLKTLIQNTQPSRIQFAHYVECLDMIEKLMYNAIEGCMNLPMCQDEATLKFFVGNRKVCQMYFRRELRTPLVNALYEYGVSSTALIHQSSHSAGYAWTRFIRYLQNTKYHVLDLDRSLIHTVHENLFILAFGLMNIGDVPGLIGLKEYFTQQVRDAEQARIQKWHNVKEKQAKKKKAVKEVASDMDRMKENESIQQIPTYFDFVWLDAMIENAKGCVEKAILFYSRFIEAHVIETYSDEEETTRTEEADAEPNTDEKEEPTDDAVEETSAFFTKKFLNRIAHLGLKCCMDAGDWIRYEVLYQLLNKTFENNLDRLSEIRGYNVHYVQSLSDFDQEQIHMACEKLSLWELNLGVNPLKSATIPTTTRSDLFKSADMYHLQALLLSMSSNEEMNSPSQKNKNATNAKLATKFSKEIFRDPLRVVSHSNYNDQYSMLLRMTCARAVELMDLNVLNSFVHSIRFDENDILNNTYSCENNNEYLLISYLKMSDLALANRTICGLFKLQQTKYEQLKQTKSNTQRIDKAFNDSFTIYTDFMYTFVRWNLIVGNCGLANDILQKLRISSCPAHLFLSTLAHNKIQNNAMDELKNWTRSINLIQQQWPTDTSSAPYQSYGYLQMTHLLSNTDINDNATVSDIATFMEKALPHSDHLLAKFKISKHFDDVPANADYNEMAIHRAVLSCYIESVELWPKGKANWLALAKFSIQMSQQLSVPHAMDADRHKIERLLKDKKKARKVFNIMISIMHETTMKLNHQTLNQDFQSASFANLRSNLDCMGLTQPDISQINDVLVSRRKVMMEYLRITIHCYHKILSRFSNQRLETLSFERDDNVALCLDLFTMLCNYGMDLMDEISPILDSTPYDAWVQLIPQLFSRLGHSQPRIRQEIEKLVMGITRSYPSKIIFPVLSGLSTSPTLSGNGGKSSNLQMALQRTLAKLRESDELSLVLSQVSSMKLELARISVLWEDKWLQVIQEIKHMMPSRIRLLEHEINLIIKNSVSVSLSSSSSPSKPSSMHSSPSNMTKHGGQNQNEIAIESELLLERYQLIMAPILELLTSLESTITSIPSTPHEYKFERKYGRRINVLLNKFRSPSSISVKSPSKLWTCELSVLLDELSSLFSIYKAWNLNEISPLLHRLKDTVISIPGMENTHRNESESNSFLVLLQSMNNRVDIIRSKTRPKKLSFVGNDGRSYQYLLKSREDLNLDERIMQFLRNCNGMISRHAYNYNKCKNNTLYNQRLRTRWYEVIPLDKKTGLIRFVDHATPLYLIFRAWQGNYGKAITTSTVSESNTVTINKRGTGVDSYRALINKYLKEINPSYTYQTLSRHKWPVSVLKKAFTEISAKAPKDLIWRELWCSSSSINDFFFKCTTLSQSVALSSVLGWLIGLGDRHIGNILLDFRTGEVVHIDFNVCFEKGYRLRVPELVPFRLTKSIQYSLGINGTTQTKGHFYCTSKYILNLLRSNYSNWIQLFSAFIYDPISEWLTKQSADYLQRQIMDLTMGLRLMHARLGGNTPSIQQITESALIGKRKKKKGAFMKKGTLMANLSQSQMDPMDGDGDFRSLLKQLQCFCLKLLKHLPLMDDNDVHSSIDNNSIKLDNLHKNMTLCLQSFVSGYRVLMTDLFYVENHHFLSRFIASQPTTQKAKHFYESYSHLHNITTKIPPKYSALLHERALESDRNWRRLIRVSYEIVHQSLCLVAFYRTVIRWLFNPLQYYKTSQFFSFFNKKEYNHLIKSLPSNTNYACITKELSVYEKRLKSVQQLQNEYASHDDRFGITNEMATELFQQKLYNLKQHTLSVRCYVMVYQIYNVKQRFAFLDTASRSDLTASVIEINDKISVNRDIELKLQLAGMFIKQLLSFHGIVPKIISSTANNNWRLCLDKSLKFIHDISGLMDHTIQTMKGDDEEELHTHAVTFDVNVDDLVDADTEYLDALQRFITLVTDISNKCNLYSNIAYHDDIFNDAQHSQHYKRKNNNNNNQPMISLSAKELHSRWKQMHDALVHLCSFSDHRHHNIIKEDEDNDAEDDSSHADTDVEVEVDVNEEEDEGYDEDIRIKYPLFSLCTILLRIFEAFNRLTAQHNTIILCLNHTKQKREINAHSLDNTTIHESVAFMQKGMELICSVVILLKVDKLMNHSENMDCYNLLSTAMMRQYVSKYILDNLDYWLYYSSLPIYAGLCCDLFDRFLGIIIESACDSILSNSLKSYKNEEIREKLSQIMKSFSNNEQRLVSDVNQRISSWINNLYKDEGAASVAVQCADAQQHHRWVIDFLKQCLVSIKWLRLSPPQSINIASAKAEKNRSKNRYIDRTLFKLLSEAHWNITDLYEMENLNPNCLLPYLAYLNNEFCSIHSKLKSNHYSYIAFEDELVSIMEEWSSDLYPTLKAEETPPKHMNKANKLIARGGTGTGASELVSSASSSAISGPKMQLQNDELLIYDIEDDEEEDIEDENEERMYLDDDEDEDEDDVDDEDDDDEEEDSESKRREKKEKKDGKIEANKRSKSPFNAKRKKENKIREMEDVIRKSMEEIQNRRNKHLLMMNHYNTFGGILHRIYELELSRRNSEFFTKYHLQSSQMIIDESVRSGGAHTEDSKLWEKYNVEFNNLLSSLNEKYGHINPMLELVLRYVSSDSGLYSICERLQKHYKMIQQDLEVIKSYILAKSQHKKSRSTQTLLSLQHRVTEMLQCDNNIYNKLARSESRLNLFCMDHHNVLTYRSIHLQIELDNLQIAISSVLKHDLIRELSPFRRLSEREANSMGDDVDDEANNNNATNETTKLNNACATESETSGNEDSNNDDENIQKDRDSLLLSYFVTMDIRNIGFGNNKKNKNENEERSKHGYDVVQYMAYKLNGTEHNIHKSSHYNTVEEFDQVKRVKCIGSNHCDQQYNLEMKTSLLTGCYSLFKLQSQTNKENNPNNIGSNPDEDDEEEDEKEEEKEKEKENDDEERKREDEYEANWTQKDVVQQLDTMIDEATDNNRLCRMYEGWAPWM